MVVVCDWLELGKGRVKVKLGLRLRFVLPISSKPRRVLEDYITEFRGMC